MPSTQRRAGRRHALLWHIGTVKFHRVVRPGEPLQLEYDLQPDGRARFELRAADALVASGTIERRPAANASGHVDAVSQPSPQLAAARSAAVAEWRRRPERGSPLALRIMAWLSLRLGRPVGTLLLYLIAAYFFLFAPRARRCMRDYLRRALGREPRAVDRFRQIMTFATIDPRSPLPAGRALPPVRGVAAGRAADERSGRRGRRRAPDGRAHGQLRGAALDRRAAARPRPGDDHVRGQRAQGQRHAGRAGTARIRPRSSRVGHIDAMLKIRDRLDQGALVGMLADRTFGDEAVAAGHLPRRHRASADRADARGRDAAPSGDVHARAVSRRQPLSRGVRAAGGLLDHASRRRARLRSKPRSRATRRCSSSTAAAIPTTGSTSSISGAAAAARSRGGAPAAARMNALLALAPAAGGRRWRRCGDVRGRRRRRRRQLDQLMALLAQRQHGEADFSEKKYLSVLKQPLESSGVLIYDAPDHLEQRTAQPRPQTRGARSRHADACRSAIASARRCGWRTIRSLRR